MVYQDNSYNLNDVMHPTNHDATWINETNTLFNHEQFRQAKSDGLLYKKWLTMKDERVRKTHAEVDDTVIRIDELFHVGDYYMRYPHDPTAGVEEVAGCRCVVEYF